jgi:hypothetical protein
MALWVDKLVHHRAEEENQKEEREDAARAPGVEPTVGRVEESVGGVVQEPCDEEARYHKEDINAKDGVSGELVPYPLDPRADGE